MSRMPEVFTVETVAEKLQSKPEAVVAELEAGRLRGFQIGGEWRTTEADLLNFLGVPPQGRNGGWESGVDRNVRNRKRRDRNSNGLSDVGIQWQRAEPFNYRWPSRANAPESVEEYPEAFEGILIRRGRPSRKKRVLIGFTTREAAGMPDRRRAVVFHTRAYGRSENPTLYPLVEFAGANDFETSRRMASVVKLPNRKQVRPGERLPREYEEFDIAVYSDVVTGPYASNSLAVVVRDDDLDGMARHAFIRFKMGVRRGGGRWLDDEELQP